MLGLTTRVDELISLSLFGVEGGDAAAARLLDQGVTGFVCGSDLMALGAIRAARQRGLRVPDGRVGRRLRRLAADRLHRPAADHAAPAGQAMAVAAVRALVDEIKGHPAPHSEYIFRPELVVRGSTARPARTERPESFRKSCLTLAALAGHPSQA